MKLRTKLALRWQIWNRNLPIAWVLLILLLAALLQAVAVASAAYPFTPPSSVTVRMYRLDYPSGANTNVLCSSGDTSYGCTAIPSAHYPYADSLPTVSIENDYLLDVVPREMGTYYHPTALQAQAIAARTYAYWHIDQGSTINNSNQFQVFVPYYFESLPPYVFPGYPTGLICTDDILNTNQRIVCAATAPRHYISYGTYPNEDLPAFTEFTGDVYDHTVSHPQQSTLYPYLLSVENPISTACGANNYGHYRGMSQEGASRWARGNQCSYAGQGDMPWSVRWARAKQILLHYYTGVHIRDSSGTALTPLYRWNPLSLDWGTGNNQPPAMVHGGFYPVTVKVQNTSLYDWSITGTAWALAYRWVKGANTAVGAERAWLNEDVLIGDPPHDFSLTISDIPEWGPGAYMLKFDMIRVISGNDQWFSELGDWPTYDVGLCIDGPCKVFIPLALKNVGG